MIQDARNRPIEAESSAELEHEIAVTRQEMDETIDALGRRLHPRALLEDLLDLFRSEGEAPGRAQQAAQRAGRAAVREIKRNPLPISLIGAGIVWYIASRKDDDRYLPVPVDELERGPFPLSETSEPSTMEKVKGRLGEAAEKVKHKVGDLAGQAREGAGRLTSTVKGKVSSGSSHLAGSAKERAHRLGQQVRDGYHRGRDQVGELMDEHPMAAAAGFFAAGIIAGLALPMTKAEDRVLGEVADDVKDEISEKGARMFERARDVATATTDAAMAEVRNQGLAPAEDSSGSDSGPGSGPAL